MTLIEELSKINSKLQIQLDDISGEHIVASNWNQDGHYDISVTFIHDKGEISMGLDVEQTFNNHDIISSYRPGIEIFWFLNDKEKKDIGMEIVEEQQYSDSIYAYLKAKVFKIEKVKKLLLKHNLPFYFKE
jgi:hypothetical protein